MRTRLRHAPYIRCHYHVWATTKLTPGVSGAPEPNWPARFEMRQRGGEKKLLRKEREKKKKKKRGREGGDRTGDHWHPWRKLSSTGKKVIGGGKREREEEKKGKKKKRSPLGHMAGHKWIV